MKHLAAAFLLLSAVVAQAQDMPQSAANAFYAATIAARPSSGGGIPGAPARARLAPLLSQRLNGALASAASAEARFMARNKNSPPLIEGDIFSSLFEGPTSFTLGACAGDAKLMRCAVALTHQEKGQAPAAWTDHVVLVKEGGWKVDDIAYDAGFAFGNSGTLTGTLKMMTASGQ